MNDFKLIHTRFKNLAVQLIKMTYSLANSIENRNIKYQLVRSVCSSASNIRAASRAKSRADLINKLKIVEEELDETMFWLELLKELDSTILIRKHHKEAEELLKITVSSIRSLRSQKS